jgi:hypothetical protein
VALCCGIPVLVLAGAAARDESFSAVVMSNLFMVFGWPALALVGLPVASYLRVWFHHRNNRVLQNPQTMELTANFLSIRGAFNNAQLDWRAIVRVLETRRFFLFFVGKNVAHFLPKDAVPPTQLAELRSRLAEWLPERVHLAKAS